MIRIIFIICTLLPTIVHGQITSANPQLAIGLLGDKTIKTLDIGTFSGRYFLLNDKNDTLKLLTVGDKITFTVKDWKVSFKSGDDDGTASYYTLQAVDTTAAFSIETPTVKLTPVYDGSLRLAANAGKLKLVNYVPIEQYVDDVLHAEVGKNHTLELYKVQATISRSYALTNINKHKSEFFNLCDKVHCQVYNGHGKPNNAIDSAVAITRGEVIVYNNKVIDAAFHANCGGKP
ncbi:MAG: SpoIID/LytB domain-containing protein [Sphingobacteriales bacterium JAD_PAG50586_3]|nr:MAG: SpoIID/LytB domain-containing protein [Sphingobacteriales bacterium JAD_PAG50586_3]